MTNGYDSSPAHADEDSSRRETAWVAVHDPSTSSARLADVAGRYPEFAAAIVGHPNCYPELAAWARSSGLLETAVATPEPAAVSSAPETAPVPAAAQPPSQPGWAVSEPRVIPPMAVAGRAAAPAFVPVAGASGLSGRDLKTVLLFGLLGGVAVGVVVNIWYWLLDNPLDRLLPEYPDAMGVRAVLYAGVLAVLITTHALFVGLIVRKPGAILATLALTLATFFPIDWLATAMRYPGYGSASLLESLGRLLLYVGCGAILVGIAGELLRLVTVRSPGSILSSASIGLAVPVGWTLGFIVQLLAGDGWPAGFGPLDWAIWLIGLGIAGFVFSGLLPAAASVRWAATADGSIQAPPTFRPTPSFSAAVPARVGPPSLSGVPHPVGPPGADGLYEHPKATQVLMFALIGMFVFAPLAIAAWVTGAKAKAEMAANPGLYRPSSSLQVGYVLGIIGTVIWVTGIVALIALLGWLWSMR